MEKSGKRHTLTLSSIWKMVFLCFLSVNCSPRHNPSVDTARKLSVAISDTHLSLLHTSLSVSKQSWWLTILCRPQSCPYCSVTVSAALVRLPSCVISLTPNIPLFSLSLSSPHASSLTVAKVKATLFCIPTFCASPFLQDQKSCLALPLCIKHYPPF